MPRSPDRHALLVVLGVCLVRSVEQMRRAFDSIQAELRNQYVLTYYTATPPEPREPPEVRVVVPGMRGLEARALLGADGIY